MNSQPVVEVLYSDDQGIIFQTSSGSSPDWHTIGYDPYDGWCCTCEHYYYRKKFCKHMQACIDYVRRQGIGVLDKRVFGGKYTACEVEV